MVGRHVISASKVKWIIWLLHGMHSFKSSTMKCLIFIDTFLVYYFMRKIRLPSNQCRKNQGILNCKIKNIFYLGSYQAQPLNVRISFSGLKKSLISNNRIRTGSFRIQSLPDLTLIFPLLYIIKKSCPLFYE